VAATDWIESGGGPLVVLARSLRHNWRGVFSNDYDEACAIKGYFGSINRSWGRVLVLGDEPLPTALVQRTDGPALVRGVYAPSEDRLHQAALDVDLDSLQPVERIMVGLRDEPYVVFDSACDGLSAETLEMTLPAGICVVLTYVVKDDEHELSMVVHRFGDGSS
jgi:Immunity protein 21